MTDYIKIVDAHEHNLKNVSLNIPKKKITVFTGVSGSGKSSLCMDTIACESRRELNETFPSFVQQYLPKYGRPHVGIIENLPVTMILDQKKPTTNSRSTVGTYTDIYAFLRLLFSRIGEPFVGYSDHFSFNHPSGKCKTCDGLGEVIELDIHQLVDFDKCLNDEGVISFPAFTTGAWRWKRYANTGLFDLNKKIKDYTTEELELFLYSPQVKLNNPPDNWPKTAKFEGIYPRMFRSIIHTKEGKRHQKILNKMIIKTTCKDCDGTRVNKMIRSCKILSFSISDVLSLPIPEAIKFIGSIEHPLVVDLKEELIKRLNPLVEIGLGYLSLSRGMTTLSGGEAQRIKIAKYINSALTDVVYVLDEPSVGLHHHDIRRLKDSIYKLRDRGNTILMVEHHKEIIKMADHIVDIGPGAGVHGGHIVFEGTYDQIIESDTLTGQKLKDKGQFKSKVRIPENWFKLEDITLHNLRNISVDIPLGIMTVIIGVAGSGKSSLMKSFQSYYHEEIVHVSQKSIGANSRSTPATYLDISDPIRKIYAKENKVSTAYFSFNSIGGCLACKGKGVIHTEMGFMSTVESVCDQCHGQRYNKEVLAYTYKNKNIAEIFDLTVEEALGFIEDKKILSKLTDLFNVGLGYIHLNQSMNTLSGGELQRIKLASLLNKKNVVYLLDEPTDGLHKNDVHKMITLFNRLVDEGNTLILVDHHLDIMKSADYLIELGPKGGVDGGLILYEGLPNDILKEGKSITKNYLN
ncbi:MAG: excinuclease ABC subunit UvrA [Clostridiales bacterium]|nr:excinuclease ABC subunit UvrA [Clostridiales bacterium]